MQNDNFTSWVANEWSDGYFQSICSESEIDAGVHYDYAREYLADNLISARTLALEYQRAVYANAAAA